MSCMQLPLITKVLRPPLLFCLLSKALKDAIVTDSTAKTLEVWKNRVEIIVRSWRFPSCGMVCACRNWSSVTMKCWGSADKSEVLVPTTTDPDHSAFPLSTFTRWLGRVVGLTHQTKWLEKGRAHLDLFDACEIRALFWSNHLDFLLQKSKGALQGCHEIHLLEFFSLVFP